MRAYLNKTLSFLLAAVLLVSVPALFPTAQAAEQTVPFTVIRWESYRSSVTGNHADVVVTKETDYVQAEVKAIADNASQRALNYTVSPTNLIASGDSVLIRVVARAVGKEGKMYLSLGKSGGTVKNASTVTIPTTWTEYFFPLEGVAETNRLYVRLGYQVQTIQFKDLEVINYGSAQLASLPTGARDATVAASVSWSAYNSGVTGNHADIVISKQTGATGMYTSFLRMQVKAIASNPTQRAANYTLSSVGTGDTVLVRLVARSANADGSDGILRLTLRDTNSAKESSSADYAVPASWTEYYIPMCLTSYTPNRLIVRLGHMVQTVEIADLELINFGSTDISTLPIGQRPLEATGTQEPDVLEKEFTGSFPTEAFAEKQTYTFSHSDIDIRDGNTVLFSTVVRGETASCHIRLTAEFEGGSTVMEYAVPVQNTRINMPITADGALKSFSVEPLDGPAILSEAKVENKLTATQEDLLVQSGMHMLASEYTDYKLSETGVGAGKTTDVVCSGNYAYSIGSGKLTVTDMTDADNPVVCGSVSGLGDTRQIALCKSGTDVMVTARGYGAWIIDVSNPGKPVIRTHYDSVEMATGISIEGDYAYISCRQYGVDVVDLSDLDNPQHICILRTGEVQSCRVVDNILYAGLWSEHRVDMYDVTDPANAIKLGSANLSGRGDGTAVYKKDGKTYLFAATGHHSAKNKAVTTPLSDLEYGQGNGMDIFDVTDPANPVWLSTSKTDGRFYSPSYDYWSVELSQDEFGKLYACLSSSYNGVFVYDVADLRAPVRLAHAWIEIPKTSANYSALTSTSRTVAYPFDRSQLNWGAVGAVAVEDGMLYIAGVTTDLITLKSDALFHAPVEQTNSTNIDPSGNFYTFDGAGLQGYKVYASGTQIHAAAVYGEYVFAAGSADGILILDPQLNLKKTVATQGNCYDVQIRDGVLYAAEGVGGLAAYSINGTTLTQLWRYAASGRAVKQVRLSATGKFAVLHVGSNRGEIVRLTDLKQMVHVTAGSQMYHHNVINDVVGGRYMCFWGNSTDERWYDFGPNDEFDTPVMIRNYKPRCSMNGGIESVGDLALSMTSTGYVLYDPATVTDISSGLTIYKPGQNITGKPSEHLGTLITTNRISGAIYIMDATTLTAPKLQKSFTVPGHPVTAVYGEDSIFIPLGYQGLMKFDLAPYDFRAEQAQLTVEVDTEVTTADGSQTVTVTGGSGEGELRYTVSDETVASADANGKLTYLKPGSFTVTVTKAGDDTYKPQTVTSQTITVSSSGLVDANLKFYAASISLHHNLSVNFKVDNAVLTDSGYSQPYVVFEFNGQTTTQKAYTVSTDGRLVFNFHNIAPHMVGNPITATLYATKDGVLHVSEPLTYSVKQYCYNTLATYNDVDYPRTTYGELRTLLVDLLNYCSVAQQYMGYETDALVNANLTDKQKAWGTGNDPIVSDAAKGETPAPAAPTVTWKYAGLSLCDSVAIRLGFAAETTDGLSVCFLLDGQEYTVTEFTPKADEPGCYYVYFKDLNAGHIRKTVSATVYQNGAQVSNTAHYSVEAYVANHTADDSEAYLAELVKAIIRYGDSAAAYVN